MYGLGGGDFMSAGGGHDTNVSGTSGGLYGGTGSDEMYGGTGDDGLQGGRYSGDCDASDSLFGNAGNDTLVAHGCAIVDYLFGGSNFDVCAMDHVDYFETCEWTVFY